MGNKAIFDQMAMQYNTPERVIIAEKCVVEIKDYLILDHIKNQTGMDFGCGTGLVGLSLADSFQSFIFVDAAPGMVNYVKDKITEQRLTNAQAICLDLEIEQQDFPTVDYIIAVQVFLHIEDTKDILGKLYAQLNPQGHLLVIDFNQNENVVSDLVHNGFHQDELVDLLRQTGFANIFHRTFYHGKNMFMNKDASLFIMDAHKE